MTQSWFRWEREAAIHLLFPTLEGSMGPLKNYTGFSFPTNILIFKDGIVTWCLKDGELLDLGTNLRKIYQDPQKEQQMAKDLKKSLQGLQQVEKLIQKTNLGKITNPKLFQLYEKLRQKFLISYAIGAISTPLSFETEGFLKKEVGLTDEQLNLLITPKQDSYSKAADKYLVRTGDIDGFIGRYFWLNNSYSAASYLTVKEVQDRLKQLQQARPNNQNKTLPTTQPNKQIKRLIELLRHYAVYKDERKKNIFIYLHYFEALLKEISQRSNLSMDDVRNIFPWEVADALNKKLNPKIIQQRKKYCVVVWKKGQSKAQVYTGSRAKNYENLVYGVKKLKPKIIKGNIASKGCVRGRVKILLAAKDCAKFKKGEVLVTFMTSPDFIMAMRKACAIVTNLGGVTSHAAIISRELGIPCIVGTKNAVQVLKDGDLVEVDADHGIVKILK